MFGANLVEFAPDERWNRPASYWAHSLAEATACELVRVKVRRGYRIASCDQPSIARNRTLRYGAPMEHRSRVPQ